MGVNTLLQDHFFILLLLGFGMFKIRRTGIARTLGAKSRTLFGSLGDFFPTEFIFGMSSEK